MRINMAFIGISSGCWYPDIPEAAPKKIASAGSDIMELFVNTDSELSRDYISDFGKNCDDCGVKVFSLHPYTSFAESRLFFSSYRRLCDDAIDYYVKYFEAAAQLGAKIVNFHGCTADGKIEIGRYAEVYHRLFERGKEYGVILAQENVRNFFCGRLDVLKRLSDILGDDVAFTLDIKQANAEGMDLRQYAEELIDKTALVHVSDFSSDKLCLMPGEGTFDFKVFFEMMKTFGYDGYYMLEVYSHCYERENEIPDAFSRLKSFLK